MRRWSVPAAASCSSPIFSPKTLSYVTPGPMLLIGQGRQSTSSGHFKGQCPFHHDASTFFQPRIRPILPRIGVCGGLAHCNSCEDGACSNKSGLLKKPRTYSCRFKFSHGCDKTFSTSSHASRHSKIHTSEKTVACAHPTCSKKFKRRDNMKHHFQTHHNGKVQYALPYKLIKMFLTKCSSLPVGTSAALCTIPSAKERKKLIDKN